MDSTAALAVATSDGPAPMPPPPSSTIVDRCDTAAAALSSLWVSWLEGMHDSKPSVSRVSLSPLSLVCVYHVISYGIMNHDIAWYHMISLDITVGVLGAWPVVGGHDIIWYHMISCDINVGWTAWIRSRFGSNWAFKIYHASGYHVATMCIIKKATW